VPSRRPRRVPQLTKLEYGTVYCENCRDPINAGDGVAWWRVAGRGGRRRWAAYCQECHRASVSYGAPIR
jgi:hypothetical protein